MGSTLHGTLSAICGVAAATVVIGCAVEPESQDEELPIVTNGSFEVGRNTPEDWFATIVPTRTCSARSRPIPAWRSC